MHTLQQNNINHIASLHQLSFSSKILWKLMNERREVMQEEIWLHNVFPLCFE